MKLTQEKLSKTIAFALRHDPSAFELTMSTSGWVSIQELAKAFSGHFQEKVTVEQILEIVALDAKKRYAVSGNKIRASQGHSFPVDLGIAAQTPPAVLYHGTVQIALDSIFELGLIPRSREFVHLSAMVDTATQVGARRGSPIILEIAALEASQAGVEFFLSDNNVWLARAVPAKFIKANFAI